MIISLRISKMKKIVLALSVLFFLSALPFSHKFLVENSSNKEPIFHGDTTKQRVAFGCNVFWGEEYIPKMLEVLESHNVHITFFIGGTWAKKNPDMLKLIASKGHEIANHSYSHPHPNNLNKEKNKEEIQKAEDIINEITQVKTKLYAPPYGEYNNTVINAAEELGYPLMMWTVDTVDWKRPPPSVIKNRVMKKLSNGALILMHPTEPTVQALPELIEEILAQGYNIEPISDIL